MKKEKIRLQKKFFNQAKNQYSPDLIIKPPLHTRTELTMIIKRLPLRQKGIIVDFAAGTGRVAISLLKKGYKVVAVDISENSLQKIIKTAAKIGLKNLIVAKTLPTKDIEVIVGADALHHVNMDEYLPIFAKALSKGGEIIFSEPGAYNLFWYLYLPFFNWKVEKGVMKCSYFNLKKLLKQSGFKNIKIQGFGLFPRPIFNWFPTLCYINDWLGDLPFVKLFAYRYIIEAQK